MNSNRLNELLRDYSALNHTKPNITDAELLSVMTELLAFREAAEKPVAYIDNDELERLTDSDSGVVRTPNFGSGYQSATIPLFTAPPLPVVPDERSENNEEGNDIDYLEPGQVYKLGEDAGWNACRATMLKGGSHE